MDLVKDKILCPLWHCGQHWIFVPIVWVCLLSACREASKKWSEEEDRAYKQGQQWLREGREEEALEKFLEVIRQHHSSPQSHLFCGKIYWESLKDPIFAIYHFRQFLMSAPEEAKEREWIPQWINSLKKLFMKQCHNRSLYAKHANDFPILLRALRKENSQLKHRVIELEKQLISRPKYSGRNPKMTEFLKETTNTCEKTYIVQEGDTLSIISQKVFGDASHWPAIFEANREQLSQPHQVCVGQRLVLPFIE
jgi:hypothetical protein